VDYQALSSIIIITIENEGFIAIIIMYITTIILIINV